MATVVEQTYIDTLEALMGSFQNLPIVGEIGVPQEQGVPRKRSRVRFTFKNWNTDSPTQFFLNNRQTELKENTDFTIEDTEGYIDLITTSGSIFDSSGTYAGELPVGSQIEGSYRFKFFSEEDLLEYLSLGLNAVNMRRPATSYANLDGAPAEFNEAIIMYAYMRCLEKLLIDSIIWNNRLLFSDQESPFNSSYMMSIIQNRLASAEKRFDDSAWFAKPRSFSRPLGVTSGARGTRSRVTANNLSNFILGGVL